MAGEDLGRRRAQVEEEISALQDEIEGLNLELEDVARKQQAIARAAQERGDEHNLHRSRIQQQLGSLEPEKVARLKAIDAEEASLLAKLQEIERDAEVPFEQQMYLEGDRAVALQKVRAEIGEIATKRAKVEEEAARRSSELHSESSMLEVDAAESGSQGNSANRELQEQSTQISQRLNTQQRRLERLRESLNSLIAEEQAIATRSEAERIAEERARELESEIAAISADREQLQRQLNEMEPVVDAHREAASGQGAEDLASFYVDSADGHRIAWIVWLVILIAAIGVSGFAGMAVVDEVAPGKKPEAQEIFHSVAIAILLVGLLLYLVRMASLQFRVHRHLEAVDRSKAAALRTYNRMVVGTTPEVRGTLVATLAEAVFRAPDSGFVDGSSDHITMIERVVGTASERVTRSS